jgi:hypothetical protein
MAAFPDIVVDPYLVCLPHNCESLEQLEAFVENLLGWADLLNRGDVNVHFPSACVDGLVEAGQYPYGHELKRMTSRFGATHLSEDLVCRVAQRVLDRTPTLEARCSINIVVFEEESYRVEPEVYITRLAEQIGWGLKHGLAVMACYQHHNGSRTGFLLASAKSEPSEAFKDDEVRVSARVEEIDSPGDADDWAKVLPAQIEESLPVAFSRDSILEQLGCLRLWGDAESEQNALDAISSRVTELLATGTGSRERIKEYRLGANFLASARANAFAARSDLAGNLIDSCARIVIDVPRHEVKPFRVSENSGDQLVRTDGARAWRTHLTKAGPGFRLMLWTLQDGSIEFANVGSKKELEIH